MTRETITGVILAGGRGRRMGGVDKGLLDFSGRPMVAAVIERLAPQVDTLLINANQNRDAYAAFGYPVLADLVGGFSGPLAGLHAALTQAESPLVATAPCDSPFLPLDLVARLFAGLQAADADLAVAEVAGRSHAVFCLCRRELLPGLAAYLAGGGRKVQDWHASLKLARVDFGDEADAFRNINTPDELDSLAAGAR